MSNKPYETETEEIARGVRFWPNYPSMWKLPGEKCLHVQRRGHGRIDLVCCRPKGHETSEFPNHLHDVPPELQKR